MQRSYRFHRRPNFVINPRTLLVRNHQFGIELGSQLDCRFSRCRTFNSVLLALIHFNMATFARDGDPGCDSTNWNQKAPNAIGPTSDPNTFRPSLLNTTQWFDSINALGAKIAVLTAKHGCGFLLWPTASNLPSAGVEMNRRPLTSSNSRVAMQVPRKCA